MRKKILTGILVLVMAMTIATPVAFAGVAPTGDPLQDNESVVDIFINADAASGIDPEDIKSMLATKLNGGLKQFASSSKTLTADDIRINTNVMSIDMSDLSKWVVYDHYGSNTGATYANSNQTGKVTAPTSWTNVFGASSVKRPYFAYYESEDYDNPSVYSIANYLSLPATDQRYVAPLDQHIYALKDSSDNYSMTFVGYGSPAYCDFLYYPTTSTGKKEVTFSVDSQFVNTHTLNGAGFLLNSGIDSATGYISGYVLFYQFSSATSLSSIRLMKINNGVSADNLHQNGMLAGSYLTTVTTITNPTWNSTMDISMEITPTSLKVSQKSTSGTEYAQILDATLDTTTYNGFGPFTQYSGHGCSQSSQFRFTNLEMGFAADSSSILDALAKSNFLAGSEKYFVNLLNESGGSTILDDDWEGIARMRDGGIRYVTNKTNPFLNDGGVVTSGAPNGSNGRTFTTYADLDELTTKIANYILSKNAYVMPTGAITLSNPVAIFDLRAGSNESVATVIRDFVGSGLPIYTSDTSKPSTDATVNTYRYKITSPSGVVQTLSDRTSPASASSPLMTVTTSSEVGTWTIDLVVMDTAEKTSSTTTTSFQVVEAEKYTIQIKAGNHMTLDDDDINPQTVTQFSPIVNIPVTADTGYVLPAGYSIGNGLYFVRLTDTTGKVTGTPTASKNATLKDARIPSTITCALGTGTEPTPDKSKYYITVIPSDPSFEYNLMDKEGNLFPASNPWTQGRETAIVFGPLDLGDTYTVVARQMESQEFGYEGIEEFALDNPAVDTGDSSHNNLLLFLAFGSMACAILVSRRRKQGNN